MQNASKLWLVARRLRWTMEARSLRESKYVMKSTDRYSSAGESRADPQAPRWWQVVFSVAAAFFGVQSSRVRRRDFNHGQPMHFIVCALLMTGAVVLLFYAAVRLSLAYLG